MPRRWFTQFLIRILVIVLILSSLFFFAHLSFLVVLSLGVFLATISLLTLALFGKLSRPLSLRYAMAARATSMGLVGLSLILWIKFRNDYQYALWALLAAIAVRFLIALPLTNELKDESKTNSEGSI